MNNISKATLFAVSIIQACYWSNLARASEEQYAVFSNEMTQLYESITNGMTRLRVEAICGQPETEETNINNERAFCIYMFKTNVPKNYQGTYPSGIFVNYKNDIVESTAPFNTSVDIWH